MIEIRVMIADHHRLFRSGLRKLLENQPDLKVAGEASTGSQAIELVRQLEPDVLLLDWSAPHFSGIGVLRQLAGSCPTRVILLTASIEEKEVVEALRCDVRGVLLKEYATRFVFTSIYAVMAGQYWIYGDSRPDLGSALCVFGKSPAFREYAADTPGLSVRELEVVKAVVSGSTNKDIARQLLISEQTVKHHITNIFDKTGASNRLELAVFAVERGLLEHKGHIF